MKRIVNILALIFAFFTIFSLLTACDDANNSQPKYKDYTITVVDTAGQPMSNVIVKITTPSGETKMKVTGKDGIASLPNSIEGNYQVKVEQGLSTAIIDKSDFILTTDVNSLKVVVRDAENNVEIYGDIPEATFAQNINEGVYNLPFASEEMRYFVFYASKSGIYNVSIDSADSDMTVGYYGIPLFVQSTHRGEGEYECKTFELVIQDISTPYVIGVNATMAGEAKLTVERTDDAPFDPQYAPWTTVSPSGEIIKCELPSTAILTDIDVTDPALKWELRDDGYYYTSDGKLIYLRIGSVRADGQYLDASIAYIAGLADENFGQNFGGYVYDENGEFVGKYSYNTLLASYYDQCSGSGVYPLTAELAEAMITHGNSCGWWKSGTINYLFEGVAVIPENAWLFLCCTVE